MKILNFFLPVVCFQHGYSDHPLYNSKWFVTKNGDRSYFHVKDSSVFVVRNDAKLSMDIQNLSVKEDNRIHLDMHNLKVHTVPKFFNAFDFRVITAIRMLMQHQLSLQIEMTSDKLATVTWKIAHKTNNDTLKQGQLQLEKDDHTHSPDNL